MMKLAACKNGRATSTARAMFVAIQKQRAASGGSTSSALATAWDAAGAVLASSLCDRGFDAAFAQQPPILLVVLAAVGDDAVGFAARPGGLCLRPLHTIMQLGSAG